MNFAARGVSKRMGTPFPVHQPGAPARRDLGMASRDGYGLARSCIRRMLAGMGVGPSIGYR
jgi:hypothetical protein